MERDQYTVATVCTVSNTHIVRLALLGQYAFYIIVEKKF